MSQSARTKIRELRALLDDGLLSPQEFEQRKNAILDAQLAPWSEISSDGGDAGHHGMPAANRAPMTELGLLAGQHIGPQHRRYRLERQLGEGGMGQVWAALDLATHAELGQQERVALKILSPQFGQQPLHVKLLIEEATRARKLAHENIVRVWEWAQDPATSSYFLTMELLEGCDLHQYLCARGLLSWSEIHSLLTPVAQALRYAWERHSLVHRDLKPGNLFLTRQREVKLLDFGIAAGHAQAQRLPGNVGTSGYRAPEAARADAKPAPQQDVYAVAVMIYQMLTQKLPAGGASAAAAPPALSAAQWKCLQQGLSSQPQQRPASVLELLQNMEKALHAAPTLVLEHSVPPGAPGGPAAAPARAVQTAIAPRLPLRNAQDKQREQEERVRAREQAAQKLKRIAARQKEQAAAEQQRPANRKAAPVLPLHMNKGQAQPLSLTPAAAPLPAFPMSTPLPSFSLEFGLPADKWPDKTGIAGFAESRPPSAIPPGRLSGQAFCDAFLDGAGFGPALLVAPAGRFIMGSSEAERALALRAGAQASWLARETPQRQVCINTPFAMGKYPVTCAEWERFAQATGWRQDENWSAPDFPQSGAYPVVGVSWRDACAYLTWLSLQTGQRYRLPSEAEWEYACRAGSSSAFSCGDKISAEQANFDGNFTYNASARGPFLRGASPVGSYAPNAFGLYDMHGNVWEWVSDAAHENYLGAPGDGRSWDEGGDPSRRMLRGGCWLYSPRYLRSAARNVCWIEGRNDIVGFRVLRELDEQELAADQLGAGVSLL
ncbi:SUMF1/EgtB/PvdO family nonheme iron enzyme [Massilia sp. W12]|uniref:SUMF1/EgtB/PvdO family nonheme iron enzyme n=1 Tax=Massilia sp. W12 TaxID=3126507 RepID=UPI0030CFCCFB